MQKNSSCLSQYNTVSIMIQIQLKLNLYTEGHVSTVDHFNVGVNIVRFDVEMEFDSIFIGRIYSFSYFTSFN